MGGQLIEQMKPERKWAYVCVSVFQRADAVNRSLAQCSCVDEPEISVVLKLDNKIYFEHLKLVACDQRRLTSTHEDQISYPCVVLCLGPAGLSLPHYAQPGGRRL